MIFTKSVRGSFFPVLLKGYGFSASTIGMLVSLMEGSSTVMRLFLGSLLRVLREDTLLLSGMVLGIAATAVTPLIMNLPALAVASAVAGIGLGLNLPLTMSLIASDAPDHLRGLAMGVRLTGNRSAQLASPVIFGVIGQWLDLGTSFYVVGGLLFLGNLAAGSLLRQARERRMLAT
jgi:MFS family permease